MPCKTVTVPGPDEQNGGGGGGGDDGGGETPADLLARATRFVKENPLPTAGVVGAGVLLATVGSDDGSAQYIPYTPRPSEKDRTSNNDAGR